MATVVIRFPNNEQPGKIKKWRVTTGTMVSVGRVLLLYHSVNSNGDNAPTSEKKLRATQFGRVKEILVKEGEIIQPGQVVLSMTECKHPTVINDLCAKCGADLRQEALYDDKKETVISEASVPMLHSIPELKVCPELAEKIGKEDEQRLLKDRKLALLVDLDQTIVHTTNDNVPAVLKDVFHYQLYGANSPWYHTRLRPGTRHFLTEMSKLFELHICTFGARNYAHTVAALLDKEGALFSYRILSRDECFNPASKTANLKALFPCGDDLVCIIDDREDVWQGCGNLVQVKPYHYFRYTGDIHSPPGLEIRDFGETKDEILIKESDDTDVLVKNVVECENNENGIVDDVLEKKVQQDNQEENIKTDKEENIKNDKEENIQKDEEKIIESSQEEIEKCTSERTEKLDDKSSSITDSSTTNDEEVKTNEISKIDDEECNDKEIKSLKPVTSKNDIKDDDNDDYLLYLEDILRRIHTEFYLNIDKGKRKPLREIIPQVRARVLKGLHLTFSGLIPTHQKLNQSRAYKVAKAFGAEVTQDLTEKTTHLVAIKPGTAKANNAKKKPNIKIVNPDWLWSCAERWEHVDERLFPLTIKARGSRIPPPHCSSPDRIDEKNNEEDDCFVNTINPLMSFTQEEIDNMDKEVDEDMSDIGGDEPAADIKDTESNIDNESDDSIDFNDESFEPVRKRAKIDEENSSDENDDGSEDLHNKYLYPDDDNDNDGNKDDDEDPITVFRRGGSLPDDLDLGEYASQDSVEIPDILEEDDDREWNAMGAALEREFLSG
ncbi:hypothetical protein PV326_003806 [Microctonus aethiopoides]|nr:hypothetical protein PV326_003806 [Microctonus aethiopoides]